MYLPLAIIFALACPLNAKTVRKEGKPVKTVLTLDALIDKTMKEGIDKPLNLEGERRLGYSEVLPSKKLQYDDKVSGDGFHHRFQVILDKNGKIPQDIIIGKIRSVLRDGKQQIEEQSFRMNLKGEMLAATKGAGPPRELVKESLPLTDADTRRAFNQELDFFRSRAAMLPIAKLK